MQETTILYNHSALFRDYGLQWEDSFLDLLVEMDCPENLLRIAIVLNNIIDALSAPLIDEIDNHQELRNKAIGFLRIAKELKKTIEASQEPSFFAAATGATDPEKALRGVLKSNPKYTLLYTTDPKAASSFQKFHQTILFLEPLIRSNKNLEFKLSDYSRASLGFRRLFQSPSIKHLLHMATEEVTSVKQLHVYLELLTDAYKLELQLPASWKEIKKVRDDQTHPLHQSVLDYDNAKYVRRVIGLIRGIAIQRRNYTGKRVTISHHNRNIQRLSDSLLIPFTFEEIQDDEGVIWGVIGSSEEIEPENIASDEEPDEDDQGEMYIIDEHVPLAAYIHEFHKRRVSSDTIKRLEKQNNYVPLSLQLLSPLEIQTLISYTTTTAHSPEELIQKMVLLCMFFTSSPLDRAINLQVVDKIDVENLKGDVTYELYSNHWIIKAYHLNYKTTSNLIDVHKESSYLRLPATKICAAVFSNFKAQRVSFEPKVCGFSEDTFKKMLLSTFDTLPHLKKGALARISNHMMLLCCERYGPPVATLLFNRDPVGSTAKNYYTTLRIELLVRRYKSLLNHLSPIINTAISVIPNIGIKPINDKNYVGARNHPQWIYIRDCVQKLKNEAIRLSKNTLTDEGWVAFHNIYVVYVLYTSGLLTGLRPINSPIVTPDKVIASANVFIHREKSKQDEFNTRFIPLLDSVLDQIQHYKIHLLSVKGRLLRLGMQPEQVPKLFFLNCTASEKEKITLLKFSIAEYKRYVDRYISAQINSNRKLLRGFLEDPSSLNVNTLLPPLSFEIIDTMMGHANLGEQYWSSTSTLSMSAIYENIKPYLKELESTLSIEALPGLQA